MRKVVGRINGRDMEGVMSVSLVMVRMLCRGGVIPFVMEKEIDCTSPLLVAKYRPTHILLMVVY